MESATELMEVPPGPGKSLVPCMIRVRNGEETSVPEKKTILTS